MLWQCNRQKDTKTTLDGDKYQKQIITALQSIKDLEKQEKLLEENIDQIKRMESSSDPPGIIMPPSPSNFKYS